MTSFIFDENVFEIRIDVETHFFIRSDLDKETIKEYLEQEEEFKKNSMIGEGYYCFDFIDNEELQSLYLNAGDDNDDNVKWVEYLKEYIKAIRQEKNINTTNTYKIAIERAWDYVKN